MQNGHSESVGAAADASLCPDLLELPDAELAELVEDATLSEVLALVVAEPGDPLPPRPPRRDRRAERYGHGRDLPPDHPATVLTRTGRNSALFRWADRATPPGAVPAFPYNPGTGRDASPEELRLAAAHITAQHLRAGAWLHRSQAVALAAALLTLDALEPEPEPEPLTGHSHGPACSGPAPPEPPPQQRALTCSTLTAAPPATAMPVPYTRCVVTLAA